MYSSYINGNQIIDEFLDQIYDSDSDNEPNEQDEIGIDSDESDYESDIEK